LEIRDPHRKVKLVPTPRHPFLEARALRELTIETAAVAGAKVALVARAKRIRTTPNVATTLR
jgi:hypothetical protein